MSQKIARVETRISTRLAPQPTAEAPTRARPTGFAQSSSFEAPRTRTGELARLLPAEDAAPQARSNPVDLLAEGADAVGGGPSVDASAGWSGTNLTQDDLFALTDQSAADYDLPPEVMRAIALQESGGIQWLSDGSVVENDNTNGTIDWGVMQLNTDGWLGGNLDVGRARTDERYNVEMGAKELRVASDYWFTQKYGHTFTMDWYRSLPAAQQREARVDLFRSYNGWLSDTSNATPYENKIDSGAIGTVGSAPSSAPLRAPSTNLNVGATGPEVQMLQRDLVKLGYLSQADMDTGPGIYGPRTQAAVKKLQLAEGLAPATGNTGPRTRAALDAALGAATPAPSTALTAPAQNLTFGDESPAVKQLQTDLVKLGYLSQADMDTGPGLYGPHTASALARFQSDRAVPGGDGQDYGPLTRAALTDALALAAQVPSKNLSYGQTSADVKALQTLLVTAGYLSQADMDTGPGIYGPKTAAAVKHLQADAGYPGTDGKGFGPKSRAALTHVLASGQTPDPTGTPGSSAGISTVADANRYFTNQWAGTAFNSDSEFYGYSDCGPTSTLMIAASLGLTAAPSPGTAENQIDHIRDLALGYDSSYSEPTNEGQMASAISQLGGSSTYLDQSLSQVDAALASGQRVLLAGDPWNAWGASMDADGQYLNHRDPGGHFVAILGKTADGRYIVADPLSGIGAIAVTGAQIQSFWSLGGGNSGAMAVSA